MLKKKSQVNKENLNQTAKPGRINNQYDLNNSYAFDVDRNAMDGRTTSNSRKLKFFYGNNPIEVLTEKKQNTLMNDEKQKLAVRTKQVKTILNSSGMKMSLDNFHLHKEKKDPYLAQGKITGTPKSLLDSMASNKDERFTRKKQVVGFDGTNRKFFYMG
eukprot:CAMPEP_0170517352 /NCGR_PEP_ID=MMETSP0209-20121228/3372_1 /TAXON_ID=665100 ORGANISM="Litonotus pictus, Strain P1" /NCGR_SAMPLE_ID=MMETSP0209 /ASSEMBLY_ACC=CAM_ASM_000301 /LENGTH=158 /DNA_ID=CAMNT_0010802581 /DNA_START=258 /DNA_END=734 /DNA_ORIENTATION=-